MMKTDLCVIGAGSGGLSVAVGAAQMGYSVILIEHSKMGGDCLNSGCVPSKALLAAGKMAHMEKRAHLFGIHCENMTIDHAAVHKHVHGVIKQIEPHDSVERMESLGIKVIRETARFISETEIQAGDTIIKAKRYVIATGSHPVPPDVPGIEKVPFFTNETIFSVKRAMEHLIIIGGGPIGMEMAQAHRRLGSKVTIIEKFNIMVRDDKEMVDIVRRKFIKEGIHIHEHTDIDSIQFVDGVISVACGHKGEKFMVEGTHLLVAAGRKPNIEKLQLNLAGVEYSAKGIVVDQSLRTRNKKIYAVGDVIGQQQFTHVASYHASIVIRNILFKMPATVNPKSIPWVTYTDPEIAHVGMTEAQAIEQHMIYKVLRFPFEENDRAQCEHLTEGLIKVLLDKKGSILGVTICGDHAGDLIAFWILAMSKNMKMKDIAGIILPYPTLSEAHKGISSAYFKPILFSDRIRRLVKLLKFFG